MSRHSISSGLLTLFLINQWLIIGLLIFYNARMSTVHFRLVDTIATLQTVPVRNGERLDQLNRMSLGSSQRIEQVQREFNEFRVERQKAGDVIVTRVDRIIRLLETREKRTGGTSVR